MFVEKLKPAEAAWPALHSFSMTNLHFHRNGFKIYISRERAYSIQFWIRQLSRVTQQHPKPAGLACQTFGRRFLLRQLWILTLHLRESIGQKKKS